MIVETRDKSRRHSRGSIYRTNLHAFISCSLVIANGGSGELVCRVELNFLAGKVLAVVLLDKCRKFILQRVLYTKRSLLASLRA
jgi:hypothetical protein